VDESFISIVLRYDKIVLRKHPIVNHHLTREG